MLSFCQRRLISKLTSTPPFWTPTVRQLRTAAIPVQTLPILSPVANSRVRHVPFSTLQDPLTPEEINLKMRGQETNKFKAMTPAQALRLFEDHRSLFSVGNYATAARHVLARKAPTAEAQQKLDAFFEDIVQHLDKNTMSFKPKELSDIVHAVATGKGEVSRTEKLFNSVTRFMVHNKFAAKRVALGKFAGAYKKMNIHAPELFDTVAKQSQQQSRKKQPKGKRKKQPKGKPSPSKKLLLKQLKRACTQQDTARISAAVARAQQYSFRLNDINSLELILEDLAKNGTSTATDDIRSVLR